MLKRFNKEELTQILEKLAFDELATATSRWECTQKAEEGTSLSRLALNDRLANLAIYRKRIKDYTDKANEPGMSKENSAIFMQAVELLNKLKSDEEHSNIENNKKLYEADRNIYTTRSYLEFPLDKKPELNALYDDFSATFLFYEDVSTIMNNKVAYLESLIEDSQAVEEYAKTYFTSEEDRKAFLALSSNDEKIAYATVKFGPNAVDVFEAITDTEERIKFLKERVEFTHLMLGGANTPNWGIAVYGEMEPTFNKFDDKQQTLPSEYCDFDKVTLAMTLKIKNNDLLQVMQSKIDIDRENLEIVDERNVRGDLYQIKKSPKPIKINRDTYEYFIRYVCPSTGRVYHNLINEQNLSTSKFYKSGDPSSFIHAWWHINNGGDDPLEAGDVIRC